MVGAFGNTSIVGLLHGQAGIVIVEEHDAREVEPGVGADRKNTPKAATPSGPAMPLGHAIALGWPKRGPPESPWFGSPAACSTASRV